MSQQNEPHEQGPSNPGRPPVRPVEYISIVYHLGYKAQARGGRARGAQAFVNCGSKEDRLAGISVSHPFIEDQCRLEIHEVLHVVEQFIRQKVVDNRA